MHMPDSSVLRTFAAMADFILVFGALLVWPLMRLGCRHSPERFNILKWIFLLQVFWLVTSLLAVLYVHKADTLSWMRDYYYAEIVGAVSWVTVLIALLALERRPVGRNSAAPHRPAG